ncbi:putative LPS assembly protein LptD [Flavisolibacter tropicus]|nr:putative LPS assembly protein LptD [Flavisolibacter tropicus]
MLILALFFALTHQSKALGIYKKLIYTSLTSDTTKPISRLLKDTTKLPSRKDTIPGKRDSIPAKRDTSLKKGIDTTLNRIDSLNQVTTDTFSLRLSKDTLDAPVNYEAEDSAVILAQEKKVILYGKTKTTYKDVTLTAPKVELNQATGEVTAFNDKDSLGQVLTRAKFAQGDNQFESDTISFNFKTQKGLTRNTFTKQDEMFVHGETIKKVNANTLFIKRGDFTTCNLDEPHFAFRTNKMKVVNNKVAITGPVHPEFEGVPVPIYLPFGFYPLSRGRHSGFLPPQFVTNEEFGLGLEGLGYYKVLNDYYDVTLRGNIYSYGGWSASLIPTYRVRYRFSGAMNLSLQSTKFNFKGDPDYSKFNTFMINWSHSVDSKARPGTSFSANVNAGSTRYNELLPNNALRNFQNQLSSSIAYSKSWAGKPYNLTLSANHNQNNATRLVNLILPDAGFTVNTLYPFQRKEAVGAPKWYEKLGIGYNGTARNQVSFYDTALSGKQLLDTLLAGASHRIPINLSLPSLGPLLVAPFVSYEEQWMMRQGTLKFDPVEQDIDTAFTKGFYTDRRMSFGVSLNTNIYGTYNFKNSKVKAIRHVIRPTFSFNYSPSFSGRYFDSLPYTDSSGIKHRIDYSKLAVGGNIYSGYSNVEFGGISFGFDNSLEMKLRPKKGSSDSTDRKVRLIDGFGFSSNYNFLADSLKLGDFNLYLRSTLFDKVNLTATANLTPYKTDSVGQRLNQYYFGDGHFQPGRFTAGSISLSTSFKSKPRDPDKAQETVNTGRPINDPMLLGDQQRLQEYMRRNPSEFVDFNIPWDISIDFAANFASVPLPNYTGFRTQFNATTSLRSSFSLTPKWNFTTNGYFNFQSMKVEAVSMSINRDMHCWQMSIGIQKGLYSSFSISINPKSSLLQDLRINRTRTFSNF